MSDVPFPSQSGVRGNGLSLGPSAPSPFSMAQRTLISPRRHARQSRQRDSRRPRGASPPQDLVTQIATPQVIWNCPFHAHDPELYPECRNKELADNHRVKCVRYPLPVLPSRKCELLLTIDLREHIYRNHKQKPHCYRCNTQFATETEVRAHLQEPEPCQRSTSEAPHGIDKDMERVLRRKTRTSQNGVEKWKDIYRVIFPNVPDDQIPQPCWWPTSLSDRS
jgi:hypothetical protein